MATCREMMDEVWNLKYPVAPVSACIDWGSDDTQSAREQGAAIERARILASLKAIEPDEFAKGLYDSLAARVEHRARREHHARVLVAIEGDEDRS